MKYFVTYKIDARYSVEVEAGSMEEAMKRADDSFLDADFGDACDIDGERIIVEDNHGNYLLEK